MLQNFTLNFIDPIRKGVQIEDFRSVSVQPDQVDREANHVDKEPAFDLK